VKYGQSGHGPFTLTAGCRARPMRGGCYPPEATHWHLVLRANIGGEGTQWPPTLDRSHSEPVTASDRERIEGALKSGSLLTCCRSFLRGLLLSLRLRAPMLPILSRSYVGRALGRAMEVIHGLIKERSCLRWLFDRHGDSLNGLRRRCRSCRRKVWRAPLQQPVVLPFFVAFRCMALSMLASTTGKLPSLANSPRAGIVDAGADGRLGGRVCDGGDQSPYCRACVACPRWRILVYISQTLRRRDRRRSTVRDGSRHERAAASGRYQRGSLMPRAGRWMESLKRCSARAHCGGAVAGIARIRPGLRCWAGPPCFFQCYLYARDGWLPPMQSGWQAAFGKALAHWCCSFRGW